MSRRLEHTHDKARGTIRESSRKHFNEQQKELAHELSENRARIVKLINDGYVFTATVRESNHYEVHFSHPINNKQQECWFNFESNFRALESIWAPEENDLMR